MTEFERFRQNSRSNGVLLDTNLLVLFIVGLVNRERISAHKRTSAYTDRDWELLTGVINHIPGRYTIAHVLAEVGNLADMKGDDLARARVFLKKTIGLLEEIPVASADACDSALYGRLGLTDAAIEVAARRIGCSVMTADRNLYLGLAGQGTSVVNFEDLRRLI